MPFYQGDPHQLTAAADAVAAVAAAAVGAASTGATAGAAGVAQRADARLDETS